MIPLENLIFNFSGLLSKSISLHTEGSKQRFKHPTTILIIISMCLNAREWGYIINSHIPLAQLFLHSFPKLFFLRVGRMRLGGQWS